MYLDHAATSPCSQEILDGLAELAKKSAYNPSSSHQMGIEVRNGITKTRKKLASMLGCHEDEVYFTSGATESNNMVLKGLKKKGHVISSAIEHDSVENSLLNLEKQGYRITRLPPKKLTTEGVIDALCDDTVLVSIMAVQNELGSIFPLHGLGEELKRRKILYHRDGVQAFGKIPFHVEEEQVDYASFSAHKLGGLKGLGILYVRRGVELEPLLHGGHQEKGMRPGTENTLGILVLGEVLKTLDLHRNFDHVHRLNTGLREGIQELGGHLLSDVDASPYILGVSFGVPGEVLLSALSLKGVYASAGSACRQGSHHEARVLPYLDKDLRAGFVRFSLSAQSTVEEIESFLNILENTLIELKRYV